MKTRAWDGERFRDDHFVDANGYVYQSWCLNSGHFTLSRVDWKLSRFTGLLDKNGKEIYEGDIIKYPKFYVGDYIEPSSIEIIEYEINGFNDILCFGYAEHPEYVEVIGDIFQNPELLEAK